MNLNNTVQIVEGLTKTSSANQASCWKHWIWRMVIDTFSRIGCFCSFKDPWGCKLTEGMEQIINGCGKSNIECEEVNNPHNKAWLLSSKSSDYKWEESGKKTHPYSAEVRFSGVTPSLPGVACVQDWDLPKSYIRLQLLKCDSHELWRKLQKWKKQQSVWNFAVTQLAG